MLTNEQINQNKATYLDLLKKLELKPTKDESNGYDEVVQFLDNIGFFTAPYTAQYTGNFDGGLCDQTLRLTSEIIRLANIYFPGKYEEKELLSLGLFVNLYRAIMYEKYKKNTKNDKTGKWEQKDAYRVKEERPTFGDIGVSSYMIMKRFIDFSDEVIEAYFNSSISNMFNSDIYDILRSYPLVSIVRMADIAAGYIAYADHSLDKPGEEIKQEIKAEDLKVSLDKPVVSTLFSPAGKEVINDAKEVPEIKPGTTKTDFEYKF